MSNELTNELSTDTIATYYPVLDPDSAVSEAIEANQDAGEGGLSLGDFPRVQFPSATSTIFHWEDVDGVHDVRELEGILVAVGTRSVLWPTQQIGANQKPYLQSNDLITGYVVGDDPGDLDVSLIDQAKQPDGSIDWTELYYNQWKSDLNGGPGKAVSESRELVILLPGKVLPVMLSVPAGSIGVVKKTLRQLVKPYWGCLFRFSLTIATNRAGVDYPQLVMARTGYLSADQTATVKNLYSTPLRDALKRPPLAFDARD